MRIGMGFGDTRGQRNVSGLIDEVSAAAKAGFSTAWLSQGPNVDALTTLAAIGDQGIELGTAVVPIPQRHPLVLASQALTVQAATGNRLTLGIGTGVGQMVSRMYGLPTDRPARRLREYLQVLRPLLRGEAVEYRGETLTAVGAVAVEDAIAPPVLVAALGPAMLRVAGAYADGVITWMTGPRTLADHIVPTITKAAVNAPRIVAGLSICVTAAETAVRSRFAADFALAGQVPEYRAMLDREGVAGPADVLLAGDEAEISRQLDRLRETGITDLMLAPFGEPDDQRRTLEFLSTVSVPSGHRRS